MRERRFELFADRHIGPSAEEIQKMLTLLGFDDMDSFVKAVVPEQIRMQGALKLSEFDRPGSEAEVFERLRDMASKNEVWRSYLGMGYSDCIVPPVIGRNILENPGWYTQYTPYQPEISQGRLEALLNFQTVISELTGLPVANASLLDEGTAAAEAMALSHSAVAKASRQDRGKYFVSSGCHPQTIAVLQTRAGALGWNLHVGDHTEFEPNEEYFGILLSYPDTCGSIEDYRRLITRARNCGLLVTLACDLMALTILMPPGELNADIAVGNSQRFGVPMGYGGPHAAFFATRDEHKRNIPGRIVGLSRDRDGNPALRLALQTREQHIRRERATSNICTSQVLLAIMAGMYAVYHGPDGLTRIARRIHGFVGLLAQELKQRGLDPLHAAFFDTLAYRLSPEKVSAVMKRAAESKINLRRLSTDSISVALDETVSLSDVADLIFVFSGERIEPEGLCQADLPDCIPQSLRRSGKFLSEPVFNSYHSETEFLRYIKRLESRDLSLATSMIPLGSCTMKLNATTEMLGLSLEQIARMHPFVPDSQARGYQLLFNSLEKALAEMTGFSAVSLQPNAGSQGEYSGLLAIRAYHHSRGAGDRRICLIPKSAHGTNPASAVMAGMKVVVVKCDRDGNIDLDDLRAKADKHSSELAALMVTYPSTHGVFEEDIKSICDSVHAAGGQVYMDGANLNALLGLCLPAELGVDVMHFNLHKTFSIPHGGGGPGVGPIGVASHLSSFLPGHPLAETAVAGTGPAVGPVAAAPWGSASILTISWSYIALMGARGLTRASQVAILNANYIARKLEKHFPVLFTGKNGLVAHECILDLRECKKNAGVEVEDLAKRLMDYGFHAPTVSWPVPGTVMIEPTESESLRELDRFCDAMIAIREEIREIEDGRADREDNLLRNSPHTARSVCADAWERSYSRERAAFPSESTGDYKFWPAVSRIDSAYGDRNLICTCAPLSEFAD